MNTLETMGKAQLHTHTIEGDGLATSRELLDKAVELGMNVLAITDHDQLSPGKQAREIAGRSNLPLEVIAGVEITASGLFDHVLALFPEETPQFTDKEMFMGVEKTVDWIHAYRGIAILAHPRISPFFAMNPRRCHIFDGIEIFTPVNGENSFDRADRAYHNFLYKNVAPLGSGDIHHLNYLGWNYFTLFPGRATSDLLAAIRHRSTVPGKADFNLSPVPWPDIVYQQLKALVYDPIKTRRLIALTQKILKATSYDKHKLR